MASRKIEWSAWKLLDCRILHQIPQGFWEPWAAPKPPVVSTNPPLEIPAYEPACTNIFIMILNGISQIRGWTGKK